MRATQPWVDEHELRSTARFTLWGFEVWCEVARDSKGTHLGHTLLDRGCPLRSTLVTTLGEDLDNTGSSFRPV